MADRPQIPAHIWSLHRQPLLFDPAAVDAFIAARPMSLEDCQRRMESDYAVIDGVAVLPVFGFLMKRGSGWGDEWDLRWGIRSVASLQATFRQALADQSAHTILLQIDSRGGTVGGLFDLADEIFAARSDKRIVSIADEWAASGGYLLAAAAERAIVTSTGLMGSVGAITIRLDATKYDKDMGLDYAVFASGDRKADGNPHVQMSDEERRDLDADIQQLGRTFEAAVGRYRAIDPAQVRAQQAAVFRGVAAVEAGLADAVGTFEDTVRELSAAPVGRPRRITTMSTQKKEPTAEPTTETPPAAPQVTAQPGNVVDFEKAARDRQVETAKQINALCREANLAAVAGSFIAAGMSIDEVKVRLADAREIVALCAMEQITDANVAVGMIEAGLSIDQVKAKLYDARAQSPAIFSRQGPGAHGTMPTGGQHPLVQRCKQLAAEDREALAQAQGRS